MIKECKHKTEYYTCKRMRLLEHLRREGFMPYLTLPDVDNPKYNVWRFKNSPELEEAIERYFEKIREE